MRKAAGKKGGRHAYCPIMAWGGSFEKYFQADEVVAIHDIPKTRGAGDKVVAAPC